jgi:hypothetical protein
MTNQTMTSTALAKKSSVVFYQLNGQDYVRSAPNLFKTLNIENAVGFQNLLAFNISRTIRQHLHGLIPDPANIDMQDRLKTDVLKYVQVSKGDPASWINNTSMLNDFDLTKRGFANNRPWERSVKIKRESSKRIKIKIPAFVPTEVIEAPWHTHKVICKIAMSVCYWKTGTPIDSLVTVFGFPYNDTEVPPMTILLELKTPKMSIVVTGMGLEFKAKRNYALHKDEAEEYFESAIINVMGV